MPSYGALGAGGIAAFAFGALLLIDTEVPGFGIPLWLISALTLASTAFVIGVVGMAAKARRRPLVSGLQSMLDASGEIIEFDGDEGWASVDGERWQVRAARALSPGQRVRVTRVDGLRLEVSPVAEANTTEGVLR